MVGKNLEMAMLLNSNIIWPQLDAEATHTFGLRVVSDPRRPNWPTVRILIDGEDILGLEAHKGFDPDTIFTESAPSSQPIHLNGSRYTDAAAAKRVAASSPP